jgi:glucosamine kinase
VSPEAGPLVAAVDLGKTTCRVRLHGRGAHGSRSGHGAPGLAAELGAEQAFDAIAALVDDLVVDGLGTSSALDAIGIGAAGAESAPAAARLLAHRVAERWAAHTVVASDVLTAHLGAFDGAAGTVLVAGTGAVAYGIDDAGERRRSDGWGPWLGDDGSGRWIGQHGLQAALRAADGRGEGTALVDDAALLAGGLDALPAHIGGADAARRLASFAPAVLARAAAGDSVATRIVADAADQLARTAASITPSGGDVAVIGGLADDPDFLNRLTAALHARGLTPQRPLGTAIDGAAALALRSDLPHERYAIRV